MVSQIGRLRTQHVLCVHGADIGDQKINLSTAHCVRGGDYDDKMFSVSLFKLGILII